MNLIRSDSTHIEAYNEGLVVFLYDDAHGDDIRKANPAILEGFNYDIAADPVLHELAASGSLVAFELESDGDLSIELAVGNPLSPDELAPGRWHATQEARLHVPSGTVGVEGYNNLQLDPDPMDDEPGPRVDVPTGDYRLTLYRADLFSYEEDDTERPFAWHVITLTPDQGAATAVTTGMLRFPG